MWLYVAIGVILGGLLPTIAYIQAKKRIQHLEGLITLHALGENLIQGEAKKIKGG